MARNPPPRMPEPPAGYVPPPKPISSEALAIVYATGLDASASPSFNDRVRLARLATESFVDLLNDECFRSRFNV